MKKRVTVKTYNFVLVIVAFLFLAAIVRLIYVGTSKDVDGMDLKEFASNRNTKTKTLYASRGTIYDSNGDELALSVNSYTLIAYLSDTRTTDEDDPQHVVDKDYTAEKLSSVLSCEKVEILKYLNKDAYQVEFGTCGKDLTETVKKQIDDLELPGIDFIEGNQRYYKMGDFASYIVGYAKEDEETGEITGELGIESYYDDELSGTDGYITYQQDAKGYQLPNVPSVEVEAKSGSDIYLTLDSNIELITETALDKLEANYTFDWAIMTVVDATTGAIVASSTAPSFDPNDLNTLTSYLNPLVSYTYEPGSTMKTFSWASAIEEGIYDGSDTYMSGSIDVADVTIKDANKVGWGTINYDTGYAYSSNVGATHLALKLGVDKLTYYYERFGFGKKTGIELAGEVSGSVKMKYKSELATAAFGQGGILVTPIQMIQAYTAIANNGTMLKPYIVDKIVSSDGNVTYEGNRTEVGNVLSSDTAKKMQELMKKANYEGLSKIWQPKSVSMMIKTGTAQIASSSGGYLTGEHDVIYSLAGIFPIDNPKYIIYTAVSKFQGLQSQYAHIVTDAVDSIASYAKITETEKTTINTSIKLDNYVSKNITEVKDELTAQGISVIVIGDGNYVTSQYPKKGQTLVKGTKVFLKTNSSNINMINLTNWSISDVKTYCKLAGINLTYEGNGYVHTQSILEGETINSDSNLTVTLISKEIPSSSKVSEENGTSE